jgi:hypothetical protein
MHQAPATTAQAGSPDRPASWGAWPELARWLAFGATALLGLAGAWLAWRRVLGALDRPLPTGALLALGLLLGLTGLSIRAGWHAAGKVVVAEAGHLRAKPGRRAWLLPTAFVILIAWAVSVPGSSTLGLVSLWLVALGPPLLAVGVASRRSQGPERAVVGSIAKTSAATTRSRDTTTRAPHRAARAVVARLVSLFQAAWAENPARPASPRKAAPAELRPTAASAPAAESPSELADRAAAESSSPAMLGTGGEHLLQRLDRFRQSDGAELLSGLLRVELAAGQRSTSAHVPFCPPFLQAPRLDVQQIEGPACRLKTAQNLPFGSRIDVKLSQPAEEPTAVVLRITAGLPGGEGNE